MRKIAVAILLPILLFGTVVPLQAREDLVRLPVLVQHFKEHRVNFSGTTFWEFLQLHYGNRFSIHRSAHDHSGLPLKAPCDHLHAPAQMEMLAPFPPFFNRPAPTFSRPVSRDPEYSLVRFADIWQPPK